MCVARLSLANMFDEFFAVQEAKLQESLLTIKLTEAGVMRALAPLLSGKPLPELSLEKPTQKEGDVPDWWREYAAANPGVTL